MNQEPSGVAAEPEHRILILEEGAPSLRRATPPAHDSTPGGKRSDLRAKAVRTEALPDALLVIDSSGITRYASPKAAVMFGTSHQALVSKPFGLPFVVGSMTEIDVLRENGEPGIAELRVSMALWNDEPAYVALLRDVTDRVRITDSLRSQAQWAQGLGDVALLVARSKDQETLGRGVCEILAKIGRFDRSWIILAEDLEPKTGRLLASHGFNGEDGLHPNTLVEAWNRTRRDPKASNPHPCSTTVRRDAPHAGTPRVAESGQPGHKMELSITLAAAGQEIGTLWVASTFLGSIEPSEIHTLQQIAEILAYGLATQSRQREHDALREALTVSPVVLYTAEATSDRPGPVWTAGDTERFLGQDRASVPDGWLRALHNSDRERVLANHRNPTRSGTDVSSYRLIHTDGSIRRVHDHRTAVRDDSGRVVKIVGALIDETDRSQIKAQKDWDALADSLSAFARGAIPEIAEALGKILHQTEWLLTSRVSMKGVAESAGTIRAMADQSKQLCQRLLACTQTTTLTRRPAQLNDWVANLVPELSHTTPPTVSIRANYAPNLPRLPVESGLLEFGLRQLLNAAWSSMPEGGTIEVTTQHVPDRSPGSPKPTSPSTPSGYLCLTVGHHTRGAQALEAGQWSAFDGPAIEPSHPAAYELTIAACVARRHDGWMSVLRTPAGATAYRLHLPFPAPTVPPA